MSKRADSKRWVETCDKWRRRLWVSDYRVDYRVSSEVARRVVDTDTGELVATPWQAQAETQVMPQYRTAIITAHPDTLKMPQRDMDTAACHEVAHIVLAETAAVFEALVAELPAKRRQGYRDWWHASHELVTTRIENVATRARWRDA